VGHPVLLRILITTDQLAEETRVDHETDFLTCETRSSQQVAQCHFSLMMMMMMMVVVRVGKEEFLGM
jgi:hypothetical protein